MTEKSKNNEPNFDPLEERKDILKNHIRTKKNSKPGKKQADKSASQQGGVSANKIAEKEEVRNLNKTLDQLDEKINIFRDSINRKLDEIRKYLKDFGEEENKENAFSNLIQNFEKIRKNVRDFDKKIYEISNNLSPKEEIIIQKRNKVINNWVSTNEELEIIFDDYDKGFDFFTGNLQKLHSIEFEVNEKTKIIKNRAQEKIKHNKFIIPCILFQWEKLCAG